MGMQYDVKSTYASSSGIMVPSRTRLKGAALSAAVTSAGTATFINNATISGTYTRVTTTATITAVNHDLTIYDYVYLDFAAGGPTDGVYKVATVTDADVFTVTVADSGNASGNVTVYNDVLAQATVSTVSSTNLVIPGEGILAQDGIRVVLTNSVTATIYYG
jgi:hypothetical protein